MSCFGSLTVFDCKSDTCQCCGEFEKCRNTVVTNLTKIRKGKKAEKVRLYKSVIKVSKIPAVSEDLPVVVRQKVIALYRRGFSYRSGENPFTDEDPKSYALVYGELSRRRTMSKMDVRATIKKAFGWGDTSAKVEVSRVIGVLVAVGVAEVEKGILLLK